MVLYFYDLAEEKAKAREDPIYQAEVNFSDVEERLPAKAALPDANMSPGKGSNSETDPAHSPEEGLTDRVDEDRVEARSKEKVELIMHAFTPIVS